MEDFELDTKNDLPMEEVKVKKKTTKNVVKEIEVDRKRETISVCPLRKERIIVRHLPKKSGMWGNNPKHVFAGGIAETSVKTFVVPKLTSGMFVNVLTDSEKEYLEQSLGLEYNAMSVYKKEDNFWSSANPNGINSVKLGKNDTYLDLSNPTDYIKYKILLANKSVIAKSLAELQDRPKATYQFVLISEGSENKIAKSKMNATMECYKEFGKIEDNYDKLRLVVETLEGRATANNVKLDFLHTRCNDLIQKDAKMFLKVIKDDFLDTKILIKKSLEAGNIVKRGDYYYYKGLNETTPLCENNEEPTYNVAARYLNAPKHQEMLLSLQAKLN